MKNTIAIWLTAICTVIAVASCCDKTDISSLSIVPRPVQIEVRHGEFILPDLISISYPASDSTLAQAARFIATTMREKSGSQVEITAQKSKNTARQATIWLDRSYDTLPEEGYKLTIDKNGISINADSYAGAIYALQTILQLLPPEIYAEKPHLKNINLPALEITDYPRFTYRGMHLDCSRHFFSADEVKRYIDLLYTHKINRFHWHLTDDQGWRMESKRYPLLTEKSAWRVDRRSTDWDARRPIDRTKGETPSYGGFYTQAEIRDIVAYAADRAVAVVPEIELPGHSSEVFAAYPELSCLGKKQEVTPGGYYPPDMATCFCAGNEETFTFLENILDETIELFPQAPYIHIGGDEVDWRFWSECPKCKARMKAEKIETVAELQSWFVKRIEKHINSRGKNILGWDEIIEGGLTPNATVMSWRGVAGGITAAKSGHDVVMTPNSHLYFDYYQNDPRSEPKSIGGLITTRTVWSYEPIPGSLSEHETKHIVGVQANLWSEFIETFDDVERMILPRISALSEVAWSSGEGKDWDDFSRRIASQQLRYKAMELNAHPGSELVDITTNYDSLSGKFKTIMVSEIYGSQIRYTLDGSEPNENSALYCESVEIDRTVEIKASIFLNGKPFSHAASSRTVGMHKGVGKKIHYNKPADPAYGGANGQATLIDGLTGTTRHNDGMVQGFNSADFDIVIDLGATDTIKSVSASFLQSVGAWIYLPSQVIVLLSSDKQQWIEAGCETHNFDPHKDQVVRHTFNVSTGGARARYVRIVGKNNKTANGLPGAGTVNWIFADEIFIY